ncbi:MAG TPA: metallophosphoesterase [Candidatus Binataceae bacterium]|nr:metallophosphoesterase [Candidatus Binataceae bacterium]
MRNRLDRRSFLRIAGTSFSIGALFNAFAPLAHGASNEIITRTFADLNGEAPAPFSFVQLSDTHVGFNGPPDPLGTKAFENAVATINRLKNRPELVIVTGDLTHDADSPDEHARRYRLFKEIAGKIGGAQIKVVPGENDAAPDGGAMSTCSSGQPTRRNKRPRCRFAAGTISITSRMRGCSTGSFRT